MSGFILKIIALAAMMIDHTGAVLVDLEQAGAVYPPFDAFYLRYIGRIAFPVYAFLIAEGCRKTRNIRKYLLRLSVFAVVSEIPFDLFMFHGGFSETIVNNLKALLALAQGGVTKPPIVMSSFISQFPYSLNMLSGLMSHQNVFFTLALGVLSILIFESEMQLIPKYILTFFVFSLGFLLNTDYGSAGIIFIWAMYYLPGHIHRVVAALGMVCYLYLRSLSPTSLMLAAGGIAAVALIACYNGQKGRSLKWMFYAVYPAHLLALAGIYMFMAG